MSKRCMLCTSVSPYVGIDGRKQTGDPLSPYITHSCSSLRVLCNSMPWHTHAFLYTYNTIPIHIHSKSWIPCIPESADNFEFSAERLSRIKAPNLWLTCSWFQIFWHFAFEWCIFVNLRIFVAKLCFHSVETKEQIPFTFLLSECMPCHTTHA